MLFYSETKYDASLNPPDPASGDVVATYVLQDFAICACGGRTTYLEGQGNVTLSEEGNIEFHSIDMLRKFTCDDTGEEIWEGVARLTDHEEMVRQSIKEELEKWSRFEFEESFLYLERDAE